MILLKSSIRTDTFDRDEYKRTKKAAEGNGFGEDGIPQEVISKGPTLMTYYPGFL